MADSGMVHEDPEVARLQGENAQLLETISIADQRLTDSHSKIQDLKATFSIEIAQLKEQLSSCQEVMEAIQREKNELQRSNERLVKAKTVKIKNLSPKIKNILTFYLNFRP